MKKPVIWSAFATVGMGLLSVQPAAADTWVYVTNYLTDSVSVIDTASNQVIETLPVGNFPEGVAARVGPQGAVTYVANHGVLGEFGNTITEIRGLKVTGTITVGTGPRGIAINPSGSRAYVANTEDNTVSVVDTAASLTIATVPVGNVPAHAAVHPDGSVVYVTNEGDGTVSVISADSNSVIDTVNLGGAHGIDVDPTGSRLYVTDGNDNLFVIDTNDHSFDQFTVGDCNGQPAVSPSGQFIYVSSGCSSVTQDLVSVVDTNDYDVVYTVNLAPFGDASRPHGIEVTPDGTRVYVANVWADEVVVIDTASGNVIPTPFLDLPDAPGPGNMPLDIAIINGVCVDPLDTDGDGIGDACDPDDDNDGCTDSADDEPKSDTQVVGSWISVACNPRSGAIYGFSGANSDGDRQLNCSDDDDDNDRIPDEEDNCPTSASGVCVDFRDCPLAPWWYRCGPECVENLAILETVSNPSPMIIDTIRVVNETLFLKPPANSSVEDLVGAFTDAGGPALANATDRKAVAGERGTAVLSIWSKDAFGRPGELITVVAEFEPSEVRPGELGQGGWLAVTASPDGRGISSLASAWSPGAGPGTTLIDGDSDGLSDPFDNCSEVANTSFEKLQSGLVQVDSDADSFGNACDGDFDQDGLSNDSDLAMLTCALRGRCESSPDFDMDGDGQVTNRDLDIWREVSRYGLPGPSGMLELFAIPVPPTPPEEDAEVPVRSRAGQAATRVDLTTRHWAVGCAVTRIAGRQRTHDAWLWVLATLCVGGWRRRSATQPG